MFRPASDLEHVVKDLLWNVAVGVPPDGPQPTLCA